MTDLTAHDLGGRFERFSAQETLFSPRVSRLSLIRLGFKTVAKHSVRVNVWRNHNFELLVPLFTPYAAYGGWEAKFLVSAYDDSFSFGGRSEADLDLIWLDSSRLSGHNSCADLLAWLGGRLRALRASTHAPIILATWLGDVGDAEALHALVDSFPGIYFADMKALCAESEVPLLDPRSAKLAGTPVSSLAQSKLARELACHWLPAALFPPVKAVALDLDHTLHRGVLGEDGISGVELTSQHAALQRYIKSLQERGIFIALLSRNEREDVEALFAERQDYPLRWADFSAIEVSWGGKGAALKKIAQDLRIDTDAILFIDDNLGELAAVAAQIPTVHTVLAHADASITQAAVSLYPGLWRWKTETDDGKRVFDLRASVMREALSQHATDRSEYLRSLRVTLFFHHNPQEQVTRLADLCRKTNQFNLALRRFNESELAERFHRSGCCVMSVALLDRLSDSGVVAVVVAERQGDEVVVEELCVSCRALGRELEDAMIICALQAMPILAGCRTIAFRTGHGPRNQPALAWLALLLNQSENPAPGLHDVPVRRILDFVPPEEIATVDQYNP